MHPCTAQAEFLYFYKQTIPLHSRHQQQQLLANLCELIMSRLPPENWEARLPVAVIVFGLLNRTSAFSSLGNGSSGHRHSDGSQQPVGPHSLYEPNGTSSLKDKWKKFFKLLCAYINFWNELFDKALLVINNYVLLSVAQTLSYNCMVTDEFICSIMIPGCGNHKHNQRKNSCGSFSVRIQQI